VLREYIPQHVLRSRGDGYEFVTISIEKIVEGTEETVYTKIASESTAEYGEMAYIKHYHCIPAETSHYTNILV
jgi:hypothetical protein